MRAHVFVLTLALKSPSNTQKLHRRLFGYAHHPILYIAYHKHDEKKHYACKKLHTTKYNELYLSSRLFSHYFFHTYLFLLFCFFFVVCARVIIFFNTIYEGRFFLLHKQNTHMLRKNGKKNYFIYCSGIFYFAISLFCLPLIFCAMWCGFVFFRSFSGMYRISVICV